MLGANGRSRGTARRVEAVLHVAGLLLLSHLPLLLGEARQEYAFPVFGHLVLVECFRLDLFLYVHFE